MTVSRASLALATLCVLLCAWAPAFAQDFTEEDFRLEIEPLLTKHCIGCHGERKAEGGLRLDTLAGAKARGSSSLPILGGALEDNELFERISSDDPEYRMPRDLEPLSQSEIEKFRRWIQAGSPWPEPPKTFSLPLWLEIPLRVLELPGYVLLAWVLLMWVRLRARRRPPESWGWLAKLPTSTLVAWLLGGLLCPMTYLAIRGGAASHSTSIRKQVMAEVRRKVKNLNPIDVFGDPPIPFHPPHPPRMGGTYYRGNCERNPRLYNGGQYRTADLDIRLEDAAGEVLEVGSPLPSQAFLRLEIIRSPHTVDELYSDKIVSNITLRTSPKEKAGQIHCETVEEGQRWRVRYPIPGLTAGARSEEHEGLIYLCLFARPHYGLAWKLQIDAEGKIAPGSEVWLGATYAPPVYQLPPPTPRRAPFSDWLDSAPSIPKIEGGQTTTDPDLLGVRGYDKDEAEDKSE